MKSNPGWLKQFSLEVVNDLFLVAVVGLTFVGTGSVIGLSAKELLSDFTPLLLGLFGIGITVSSLKVTIKEGRERARQERDQAVMPVLALRTKLNDQEPLATPLVEMYYPLSSEEPSSPIEETFVLDNIGLGAALKIRFICEIEGKMFLAGGEIDTIKSDSSVGFDFSGAAPLGYVNRIITVYDDIFGKRHVSFHNMDFYKDFSGLIVFSNDYEELASLPENKAIEDVLLSQSCNSENIIAALS